MTGDTPALSYTIDLARRLVNVRVCGNVEPREIVRFYNGVMRDPLFQPGFGFVIDRRGLLDPPLPGAIRAFVAHLGAHETEMGVCKIAVVTAPGVPASVWREAPALARHYTPDTIKIFQDLTEAEAWVTSREPDAIDDARGDASPVKPILPFRARKTGE